MRGMRIWNRGLKFTHPKRGASISRLLYQDSRKKHKEHRAYLLPSQSIFENLAFEHWLYSNRKFDDVNMLLLWRSQPCVVIGRHQNPWAECDLYKARTQSVDVARRYSGGGTVYHDLGNLNCSFFTSRADYNRTHNSQLIVNALKKHWDLDVGVASVRDDIFLESFYKISGSSSKLGPSVAYHHCTLLFDVDKDALTTVLHTDTVGLQSRATESIRSRVKNLSEVSQDITFDRLAAAIAEQYLSQGESCQGQLETLDPTSEQDFPGVTEMCEELKSWQMVYGRTPKFNVKRTFSKFFGKRETVLRLEVEIEKGLVKELKVDSDCDLKQNDFLERLQSRLKGCEFLWDKVCEEVDAVVVADGGHLDDVEYHEWIKSCVHRLFTLR